MRKRIELAVCVAAVLFGLAGSAFSVTTGEKVEFEGWIISRQGESMNVYTVDKGEIHVLVTPYTKVQEPRGPFKIRKTKRDISELLPGLKIKVKGVGNTASQVLAETIRFSASDLKTAYALKAGVIPLQNQVGVHAQKITTLERRFADLTNYAVRSRTFVYFPSGSSTLSVAAEETLRQLLQEAESLDGYFIQVKGYTDSTGTASLNQDLSMRRAQAVMAYLQNAGSIPLSRMLTPGAMGESTPVSSNSTPHGRAENRRVEVTILVNRGLAGEQLVASTK